MSPSGSGIGGRLWPRWTFLPVLLVLAIGVLEPSAQERDDRSRELFFYRCVNDLGRREITLFANGTIRLREGLYESEVVYLAELGRDELAAAVVRLRPAESRRLPTVEFRSGPIAGRFVESCELRLELPEELLESYNFTHWDVPPLRVARLIQQAEELAALTHPPAPPDRLPADYEPRRGDVLLSAQHERYEIRRLTSDGKAVELVGLDSPMRIYIALEDLGKNFVSLEEGR